MANVNTPAANAANPSKNFRLPTVCTAMFHSEPWGCEYRGVKFEFVVSLDFAQTDSYSPDPQFFMFTDEKTQVLVDMPYEDEEFQNLLISHIWAENAVDETVSDELQAWIEELLDSCIEKHGVTADAK